MYIVYCFCYLYFVYITIYFFKSVHPFVLLNYFLSLKKFQEFLDNQEDGCQTIAYNCKWCNSSDFFCIGKKKTCA